MESAPHLRTSLVAYGPMVLGSAFGTRFALPDVVCPFTDSLLCILIQFRHPSFS
jgi:hypothetical protein